MSTTQTKQSGTISSAANGANSTAWTPTGTLVSDLATANAVSSIGWPWKAIDDGGGPPVILDYTGVNTYKLSCTNFGFTLPATDIVVGISVTVKHAQTASHYAGTDVTDQTIQLIGLPAPDVVSSNKADGVAIATSLTLKTYGTLPGAYWGLTGTLLGSDVNSSSFGVAIAYKGTPYTPSTIGTATPVPFVPYVDLDYLEITVTSQPGGCRILNSHEITNARIFRSLIFARN